MLHGHYVQVKRMFQVRGEETRRRLNEIKFKQAPVSNKKIPFSMTGSHF